MTTRCAHRGRRGPPHSLGPVREIPVDDDRSTSVPIGRFVQLLSGEFTRFGDVAGLSFDEFDLLCHLLAAADHRTGIVAPVSQTELARRVGRPGPSGRRTVGGWLTRLAAVGAVRCPDTWPGPIEVLVYRQLVHGGSEDSRRGFVQLVPAAIEDLVGRGRLSPTARALLVRLVVVADSRTQSLPSTGLGSRVGLGAGRLQAALDELLAAGFLQLRRRDQLHLVAYSLLVRPSPPPSAPRDAVGIIDPPMPAAEAPGARQSPDRAPSAAGRAPSAAEARAAHNSDTRVKDQDISQDVKTTPPTPPQTPGSHGQDGRGGDLVSEVSARLTEAQRNVLHSDGDRLPLLQLTRIVGRLLDGGWSSDALAAVLVAPLPQTWRSPARLLVARAQALPPVPSNPEELRAAAEATQMALEVAGAEAYARNLASAPDCETEEIVGGLARMFSGGALEAGMSVLAAMRPGFDLDHARQLAAATAAEARGGDWPKARRDAGASGEPVGIGLLLLDGAVTNTEGRST